MKRILVTGGAGFIGSHVADAYEARGDEVWIVDDLSTGRRENVSRQARFFELSVGAPELRDVFRDAGGFDIVSHHAAQVDVRKSVADPRFDARVNLDGLLNVLECARAEGMGRMVFVSSGGVVYGETPIQPTPEHVPKAPRSPYGVAKLAAEFYLQYYLHVHGMSYVALRYGNVYGPRQDPHGEAGVVAIFSERIARGEPVTVYGDGLQTRDYIFVGDVVAANLAAGDAEIAGTELDQRAFNVGTGTETNVVELAAELMRVAGRSVEVRFAEARAGELRHNCLDASSLQALGWSARTSLPDGLRLTYDSLLPAEAR